MEPGRNGGILYFSRKTSYMSWGNKIIYKKPLHMQESVIFPSPASVNAEMLNGRTAELSRREGDGSSAKEICASRWERVAGIACETTKLAGKSGGILPRIFPLILKR